MVIITSLTGESLPLVDIKFLSRTRGTNGDFEIFITTNQTNKNKEAFDLVEHESIITLSDGNKFRIKNLEKEIVNDVPQLEVTARHTFYDRVDDYQYDIIEGEKVLSLHQVLSHAFENTDITFIIKDDFDNYSFENFGNTNPIRLFKEAQDKFDFEFSIDNNTHLEIYKQVGSKDKGLQMRWKQNIKTIKQTDNTENLTTYIKGFYGDILEDDEGNIIEDAYEFETDYTSPNAKKYGVRHAEPYYNEKIKHESTMIDYLKANISDEPEIEFQITYEELAKNVNVELEKADLGDTISLVHEKMKIAFDTRILEVTDYPLHPQLKPIYTISSTYLNKLDRLTSNIIDNKNLQNELDISHKNQSELTNRLEQAQQAVDDVNNAMKDVDKEMDRLENEVIPEVEQAIKDTSIPSQPEPPIPTNSKLWWDTSQNPPILMRYDDKDEKWVVLAVTEEDIDALIQQMRDEAIQQGITYTDAQIQAARDNIIEQLDTEIGDVNSNIDDLTNMKDELADRVDTAEQEIIQRVSKTDYQSDKTDILSSIESNESSITQLSDEVELRVTKEEFENGMSNISTANMLTSLPSAWEQGGYDANANPVDNGDKGKIRATDTAEITLLPNTDYTLSSEFIGIYTNLGTNFELSAWAMEINNPSDITDITYKRIADRELFDSNGKVTFKSSNPTYENFPGVDLEHCIIILDIRASSSVLDINHLDNFQLMLNKGTVAHDYQPHSPDIIERISSTEATLTIHADSIEQKAEKSELTNFVDKQEYTEKVGSLTTSIDSITGTVQDIEADVDKNTGDITRASSKIGELEVTADDITSTVSRLDADLDTANEAISRVEQTADGIVSTVSRVETELNELEIGGVNLVKGTGGTQDNGSGGMLVYDFDGSIMADNIGKPITVSFKIRTSESGTKKARFYFRNSGSVVESCSVFDVISSWTKYEHTFTITQAMVNNTDSFGFQMNGNGGTDNFAGLVKEFQVEFGNKATSYEQAPEDLDARMIATETTIEQLPDKINLAVTEGIEDLEIGGSNLIPVEKVSRSMATLSDYKFTLTKNDSGNPYIRIPGSYFSDGAEHTISFKVKKISGNVTRLAGHVASTAVGSSTRIYRDGALISNGTSWSGNNNTYPNDTKEHYYVITFKSGNPASDGSTSDYWYIQPNRGNYGENFKLEIWDFQLEEGSKATSWSLAEEDRVNKTNVLSSINLSTEGVKIQGARIDIQGLVSILNADGSTGTMIDGGKIVGQSITANKLNVNNIFGNSAVIAKIQADSVKTAKLSAEQIDTGTLNANLVSVINLSANSITGGTIDAKKVTVNNIDASKINVGELTGIDIVGARFRSASKTDYMEITGGNIELSLNNGRKLDISPTGFYGYNTNGSVRFQADESRVTSAAFGTNNGNVYSASMQNGEHRIVDYSSLGGGGSYEDYVYRPVRALEFKFPKISHGYFSIPSGGEFRFTGENTVNPSYSPVRLGKLYSNNIESRGDILYLRGATRVRTVSKGSTLSDYIDLQTNRIYAHSVTTNADLSGSSFYVGTDSELRVTSIGLWGGSHENTTYRDVRANYYYGTAVSLRSDASGVNFHVRPANNGEVQITSRSNINTFRPVKASSFVESSSIKSKENIKTFTESALNVVTNLDVVEYNYKDDEPKTSPFRNTAKKERYIGFIAENSNPISSDDGEGVDLGKVLGYNTKAIQELAEENDELRNRIEQLEQLLA